MDREIQDGLENYLHNRGAQNHANVQQFEQRLSGADAGTQRTVAEFVSTSEMLHTLRAEDAPALPANFYARVMERIEAQRNNSFWSVFLNPQFSRRLVLASAALLVLLGVTLISIDGNQGLFGTAAPELVEAQPVAAPQEEAAPLPVDLAGHSDADHDEILVQLATYHE
jgi:hypothetical protein